MEAIETNKILTKFMGIEIVKRNNEDAIFMFENAAYPEYFRCTKYNTYHLDWNELMKVVSKIEGFKDIIIDIHREATVIKIYAVDGTCVWKCTEWDQEDKIGHVYKAIINFLINYYSEINPTTGNKISWEQR